MQKRMHTVLQTSCATLLVACLAASPAFAGSGKIIGGLIDAGKAAGKGAGKALGDVDLSDIGKNTKNVLRKQKTLYGDLGLGKKAAPDGYTKPPPPIGGANSLGNATNKAAVGSDDLVHQLPDVPKTTPGYIVPADNIFKDTRTATANTYRILDDKVFKAVMNAPVKLAEKPGFWKSHGKKVRIGLSVGLAVTGVSSGAVVALAPDAAGAREDAKNWIVENGTKGAEAIGNPIVDGTETAVDWGKGAAEDLKEWGKGVGDDAKNTVDGWFE